MKSFLSGKNVSAKGFTLVELAIVITIIGLLIGGILKGQEMILNSRVTATVAQLQGYQAAVTSFRDVYDALPGDFLRAPTRLPGCNLGCTPGAQDDYIGNPARDTVLYTGSTENGDCGWDTPGNQVLPNPGHRAGGEVWLFWQHLAQAGLISGISSAGLEAVTPFAINVTHPEAKIGGTFWVRTNRTGAVPVGSTSTDPQGGPTSTVMLMLLRNITVTVGFTSAVTTKAASMIDTKMDDGNASRGNVQGIFSTCYAAGNDSSYNIANGSAYQCGLAIGLIK